jgi:glucose/arabinose dehydrogenase
MKKLFFYGNTVAFILCIIACQTTDSKKLAGSKKKSDTDSVAVKLELVTTAIETPVELNVSPDNTHRIFVTDNQGKVWILKNDSLLSTPFLNIKRKTGQQDKKPEAGAIFSVAFHPLFATNGKFFVAYSTPPTIQQKKYKLVISEFTASKSDNNFADPETEHLVIELEGNNIQNNGAQIAFGPDGFLYISIGDDKLGDSTYIYHAQDLNLLNGKLLRIDVNRHPYAIPADNPFVAMKNTRPEIWAYGFRKMWRFSFDPSSHQLFGADVGEKMEEEIDIVQKGANYGWPFKEGNSTFEKCDSNNKSTFISPINTYNRKEGICIIGGSFYYGKEVPLLKDKYVFADFGGSMFTLMKNATGTWIRQPLKIVNKPADPFLICGCNIDENNEIYVMGILNTKTGPKGAVYKIIKG